MIRRAPRGENNPDYAARMAASHAGWRAAYTPIFGEVAVEAAITTPATTKLSWEDPQGDVAFFVAEVDGKVVGAADLMRTADGGLTVEPLHVLPAFKRQGIGRQLWAACIQEARRAGAKRLVVMCLADNPDACTFYEAMSARIISQADWMELSNTRKPVRRYEVEL